MLTFQEKKQSITHLFNTFSGLRLGCDAFILAKRSEKTVQNQCHFKCEIPPELFNAKDQRSGSDVRARTATKHGSRPSAAFNFARLDMKSTLGMQVDHRLGF